MFSLYFIPKCINKHNYNRQIVYMKYYKCQIVSYLAKWKTIYNYILYNLCRWLQIQMATTVFGVYNLQILTRK